MPVDGSIKDKELGNICSKMYVGLIEKFMKK
jgi:hypothetical protein